mgnify:CR=1 FL=1
MLERYYSNTCAAEERKMVEIWLNSQEPQSPNEEKLLSTSWETITTKVGTAPAAPSYKSYLVRWGGIAAIFVILLSTGIYGYKNFYGPANESSEIPAQNFKTISAELGEKKSLVLPDGSTVVLNSASELKYPDKFDEESRVVSLKGHAHFNIQRDENRPFIIYTATSKTQVLGTSFDVIDRADTERTEVVVTSGKVRFSELKNEKNSVDLTVDKQGILLPNSPIIVNGVTATYHTAWKEDILLFENKPFGDIVKVLERWYAIDITVNNQELLERQFTFTYENPSVEELFERMAFVAKFEYAIDGQHITIY